MYPFFTGKTRFFTFIIIAQIFSISIGIFVAKKMRKVFTFWAKCSIIYEKPYKNHIKECLL